MEALPQIILAIISALSGGLLLGLVQAWVGRDKSRLDDVSAFRRELLDRVRELERSASALEEKLDDWQQRYYALKAENEMLKGQIGNLLMRLAHYEITTALPANTGGQSQGGPPVLGIVPVPPSPDSPSKAPPS